MTYPTIKILPGQDRRMRAGSPWLFSNELRMDADAKAVAPGSLVRVMAPSGKILGVAQFNPHSLIAARMLRIDVKARSSMAEDLRAGRVTEIDALCGEIVRLAERQHVRAPINARMVALVKAWPQQPVPMGAAEMKAALGV